MIEDNRAYEAVAIEYARQEALHVHHEQQQQQYQGQGFRRNHNL